MDPRRAGLLGRALLMLTATAAAMALTGCASDRDAQSQFDAARVRAATALLKVDPALAQGPAETVARTTMESTSTPRSTLTLAALEPLGGGRDGWLAVMRVEVKSGGLFAGSSTQERCYAYELEAGVDPGLQVPHAEVDCP